MGGCGGLADPGDEGRGVEGLAGASGGADRLEHQPEQVRGVAVAADPSEGIAARAPGRRVTQTPVTGGEQARGVRQVRGETQQQALSHVRNLAALPVRPAGRDASEAPSLATSGLVTRCDPAVRGAH